MAPKTGVPIMVLHGRNDRTVPANFSLSSDGYYYTTGVPDRALHGRVDTDLKYTSKHHMAVKDIFEGDEYSTGWLAANGCSGRSRHYHVPYEGIKDLHCLSEGDCTGE